MPKNAPKTDVAPPGEPLAFEAALAELETIASRMEEGAAPLNDMLNDYQRAALLLGQCRSQLQAVETQVKVIDAQLPSFGSDSP